MKCTIRLCLAIAICFASASLYAQNTQDYSNVDLSTVNVDDLTDDQVRQFVERAESSGMSQGQLEQLARQRGMSDVEISKLRTRIYSLRPDLKETEPALEESEAIVREASTNTTNASTSGEGKANTKAYEKQPLPVFGKDFFTTADGKVDFTSNENVAVPTGYVLGVGDQVLVDIYGASEISYKLEISPQGQVMINGVGPVSLVGLSVEQAKSRLYNALSRIYSGMRGSNPNTFFQLSLGNIKSISVNIIGQVDRPGAYTISSLSTVLNALYAAGGPSNKGTFRDIKLMREGKEVGNFDIYSYLFDPNYTNNPMLQNGDIILINPFTDRVALTGQVKNEARFELTSDESLADLFSYAGGFIEQAYSTQVTIHRSTGAMRSVLTVSEDEYATTPLQMGDSIHVGKIIDRYENRVTISGAVFRPGAYELEDGMLLSDLFERAEGLREDAFMGRGNIFRLGEDLSPKNISFEVKAVANGSQDLSLQRDDQVIIQSVFDLRAQQTVDIKGEVRSPGIYPFQGGMTVEDLVVKSGGFKESANKAVVEVARQLSSDQGLIDRTAEIFTFAIDAELNLSEEASDFTLNPFDVVLIKRSSYFHTQELVKIEGEVLYPGFYALESREDKITDLIARAGGLTEFAYVDGATILRRTEYYIDTLSAQGDNLESDIYRSERLRALQKRDADANSELSKLGAKESIGVKLDESLKAPGSKHDLILNDGDVISIPRQIQTVRVRGSILYPNTIRFDNGMSAKRAISQAGGFTDDARPIRTYVVYANGFAERTKRILFFKKYPKLKPGAEVIVPQRIRERKPLEPQQLIAISSSLATLVLVLTQINN